VDVRKLKNKTVLKIELGSRGTLEPTIMAAVTREDFVKEIGTVKAYNSK